VHASDHVDLIARLLAYQSGRDRYLAKAPNLNAFRDGAREFIGQGGESWVWHAHLLSYFGDNANSPAPLGDQVFVRLIYETGTANHARVCMAEAKRNGIGPTFLVLSDLSGPDLRVERGTAYVLSTHQPVIYKDQVLFVETFAQDPSGAQADVFKKLRGDWIKGRRLQFLVRMIGEE
jgi:hypothetical protein